METKHKEILEQYNFKIHNSFRIRGAHIVETNEGPKLLKRLECSINQVEFEDKIQQTLVKKGYPYTDLYVRNKYGEIITSDSGGNKFIIKSWCFGRECDLRKEDEVLNGVVNLAYIHKLLTNVPVSEYDRSYNVGLDLNETFDKRMRELKRIRAYIRQKKKKKEFEICFLRTYEHLYNQAIQASKLLKASKYEELLENAMVEGRICHGNYNYHNVIIADNKNRQRGINNNQIITTNFDKAVIGIQICDLYDFIRKTMEKNNWDIELGNRMIQTYKLNYPLSKEEARLLYILLLYPEKFWKVSNRYYNGKKAWVPKRTIQKLVDVKKQINNKDNFLKQLKEKL